MCSGVAVIFARGSEKEGASRYCRTGVYGTPGMCLHSPPRPPRRGPSGNGDMVTPRKHGWVIPDVSITGAEITKTKTKLCWWFCVPFQKRTGHHWAQRNHKTTNLADFVFAQMIYWTRNRKFFCCDLPYESMVCGHLFIQRQAVKIGKRTDRHTDTCVGGTQATQ